MAEETKEATIVGANGEQLLKINTIGVKNDKLCVNGNLMGAWPTDMFLDAEGVKLMIDKCDIPAVLQYIIEHVLGGTIEKIQ